MSQDPSATRCGTVVLAGHPNAGKSSLLNALVGERLAITSPKPQTTRLPVTGVRTEHDTQIVFIDPPGLLEPEYALHESMLAVAESALRSADAVLYLHPITEGPPPPFTDVLGNLFAPPRPLITVLSKADLVPKRPRPDAGSETLAVSAETGEGLDALLSWCRKELPIAPFRFDPDYTSTQPVRFFVTEYLREAAFDLLGDEVPYALAAVVDEFREAADPVYIRVTVYVERESQKRIVIGHEGRTIRQLGVSTRKRVEALIDRRVYLDLWVKALPRWRRNEGSLRSLGFPTPHDRGTHAHRH